MSTPMTRGGRSVSTTSRKAPVFVTESGKEVEAKPGQSVTLADATQNVDVCVVFDTTGSMSDKIPGLSDCMNGFVEELSKLRLDWRFSVVPFGDLTIPGDTIEANLPFVKSVSEAQALIRGMRHNSGGGNNGESSLEAMQVALSKPFRKGAVKVIIFLTDEPPLQSRQMTPRVIQDWLRSKEFVCFVVSPPRQGYEPWATENAGKWYPISSHVNTSGMLEFFRKLLKDVAKVSNEVFTMGGGSVAKYVIERERRKELGSS